MKLDKLTGLIEPARHCVSPNQDDRPDENDISLIVIHNISLPPKEFGGEGVEQLFTNCLNPKEHPYYEEVCDLKVSSHLFIRRDGELVQFVPLHKRAWHAGQSVFEGRSRCNDFAIGIELEGADDIPYEENQYHQLADVIRIIFECYPGISDRNIVGHSDISPDRKTDPGPAFDWYKLKVLLGEINVAAD
ncbi:MAG: 1,6-anhydro-N-acetylmuramyl-L-alanine amidase AmpD [Gammaproteobacteria bacterium]|nr:MAG: 1,6-anhydro-N-acetylmuramyl-L-alanine amidase AmpD [Gammaproteobacteria bacterium]